MQRLWPFLRSTFGHKKRQRQLTRAGQLLQNRDPCLYRVGPLAAICVCAHACMCVSYQTSATVKKRHRPRLVNSLPAPTSQPLCLTLCCRSHSGLLLPGLTDELFEIQMLLWRCKVTRPSVCKDNQGRTVLSEIEFIRSDWIIQSSISVSVPVAESHTHYCRLIMTFNLDPNIFVLGSYLFSLHHYNCVSLSTCFSLPLSLCPFLPLCFNTGYDVPAAPGAGLPALAPRGPPWPQAPEHPGHQWRTDQTSRLWPSPHLQLPDGAHLCGELCCSYIWTQWDSFNSFLQQRFQNKYLRTLQAVDSQKVQPKVGRRMF